VLVSVTRDRQSRTICVKLVNPTDSDVLVTLDVKGATLAPTANAVTLAADPQATNAIDAPERVVSVVSNLTGVTSAFAYKVPAHGIVALMLASR
jgi:alpha-L-arabinofuranosidase